MKTLKKRALGFGLLELMLSMVIVALLLIMATRYYNNAHTSERINEAVSQTAAVISAANEYALGNGGYTGITIDSLASMLPDHSTTNPWGSVLTLTTSGTNANEFILGIATSDPDSCTLLANALNDSTVNKYPNSKAVCAGSTVSFTYNYNGTAP